MEKKKKSYSEQSIKLKPVENDESYTSKKKKKTGPCVSIAMIFSA